MVRRCLELKKPAIVKESINNMQGTTCKDKSISPTKTLTTYGLVISQGFLRDTLC